VAGLYNPTSGLIARNARQELFISQKLFEVRTELRVRDTSRQLFRTRQSLFDKHHLPGSEGTSSDLFQRRHLFGDSTVVEQYDQLQPKENYNINTLKKQPKKPAK
jgi:hypothetical protein